MNTLHLKELQKLSKGLSLLYVEKNQLLQKKVFTFCGKSFENFYQVLDGVAGLNYFILFKPQIVLLDICLKDNYCLELITQIKEINPQTIIITLSDRCGSYELLELMDFGIHSSLLKPLNLDSLIDILIDATLSLCDVQKHKRIFNTLFMLERKNNSFFCLNKFKGLTIQNECKILLIDDDMCKVKLQKMQIITMLHQPTCILKVSDDKYLSFYILSINEKELTAILIKPAYIDINKSHINKKTFIVDESFKLGGVFKNKQLKIEALEISKDFLSIYLDDVNTKIDIDDTIEITFGFESGFINSSIKEKKFNKIFAKMVVCEIVPYKNRFKINGNLFISKTNERGFLEYLAELEVLAISELKSVLKKK